MVAEVRKTTADDPLVAPYRTEVVDMSRDIWVGLWDGELALIWGIVPQSLLSDTAYVWTVSTPTIKHCAKTLLRLSRAWLREMSEEFPTLMGLCNCKTTYVKHLGAQFEMGNGEYHLFTIKAR